MKFVFLFFVGIVLSVIGMISGVCGNHHSDMLIIVGIVAAATGGVCIEIDDLRDEIKKIKAVK